MLGNQAQAYRMGYGVGKSGGLQVEQSPHQHRKRKRLWRHDPKFERNRTKVLLTFLMGHGILRYTMYRSKISPNSGSPFFDQDEETAARILYHCPALVEMRYRNLGNHFHDKSAIAAQLAPEIL